MFNSFEGFFKPATDTWNGAWKEANTKLNEVFSIDEKKEDSLTHIAVGGVIGLGLGAGAIALAPVMGVPVAGALGIGAFCLATTAIGAGIGVGINYSPSQEAKGATREDSKTAVNQADPAKAKEPEKENVQDYAKQATKGFNDLYQSFENLLTGSRNVGNDARGPQAPKTNSKTAFNSPGFIQPEESPIFHQAGVALQDPARGLSTTLEGNESSTTSAHTSSGNQIADPAKAEEPEKENVQDYAKQATKGFNDLYQSFENLLTGSRNVGNDARGQEALKTNLDTEVKSPEFTPPENANASAAEFTLKKEDTPARTATRGLPTVLKGTRSSASNPPVSATNGASSLETSPPKTPAPTLNSEVTDATKKEQFKAQLEKHFNQHLCADNSPIDLNGKIPQQTLDFIYRYKLSMALDITESESDSEATAKDKINKLDDLMRIGVPTSESDKEIQGEALNKLFVDQFSKIGVYPKIDDIPPTPFARSLRIGSQAILKNSESQGGSHQNADTISALSKFLKYFKDTAENNNSDTEAVLAKENLGSSENIQALSLDFLNKAKQQREALRNPADVDVAGGALGPTRIASQTAPGQSPAIAVSSSPAPTRVVAPGVERVEHPLAPNNPVSPIGNSQTSPQVAADTSTTPQQAAAGGGGAPMIVSPKQGALTLKSPSSSPTNTAAASSERKTSVESGVGGAHH